MGNSFETTSVDDIIDSEEEKTFNFFSKIWLSFIISTVRNFLSIALKVPASDEYKEPLTVHYLPRQDVIKNTHREKAPASKTQALTKSMNMDIWIVGSSNQLFRF